MRFFRLPHFAWSLPLVGLLTTPVTAQIVPDATLPAPSTVNTSGATSTITGGTLVGPNLFHSFQQFSLLTGTTANFSNPLGVQNIITRVTGGGVSTIDGTLQSSGTGNFFLLNPGGIVFGPNARLSVGGSFLASTASGLVFADGTLLSTNPAQPTLLTVSVPSGLQFGSNPAAIRNQAGGAIGLQVPAGKTLALVGGDVLMDGGKLTASGGRIELGSVASAGVVSLTPAPQGWALSYGGMPRFGTIQLSQLAAVDTSGPGGGPIQIQARNLSVTGGAQILASTTGARPGGTIVVNATDSIVLSGTAVDPSGNSLASGLFSFAAPTRSSTGAAGDLRIQTGQLIVQDGAAIRASSFNPSTGPGGNISINVGQLVVQNSQIQASTTGPGRGGTLTVNASQGVDLNGVVQANSPAGLFAQSFRGGAAGNLTIVTPRLAVRNGATVAVSGRGAGAAGNLSISAPEILLDTGSFLRAETQAGRGNINLQTQNLQLRRGSGITTNATGAAAGGNIGIQTATLVAFESSRITANAQRGFGGQVNITAQGIFLDPTSAITATSELGPQFNGTVTVQTPDTDPSQGLVQLEIQVVDPSSLISQDCAAGRARAAGEFIITGRGGLPPAPTESLTDEPVLADLGRLVTGTPDRARSATPPPSVTPTPQPLVEAQGWGVNPQGKVVLLAQAPTTNPQSPWNRPPSCNAQPSASLPSP